MWPMHLSAARRNGATVELTAMSRIVKPRPVGPGGALLAASPYSPFCLRLRDQMREKVSPSSTRFA